MSDQTMIHQLREWGTHPHHAPLSGPWRDGARELPPDRTPVLAVATDPRGGMFYAVMRHEADHGRWTSPGGVVVYWTDKHRQPPPHWLPIPPPPPEPLSQGQIVLLDEMQEDCHDPLDG